MNVKLTLVSVIVLFLVAFIALVLDSSILTGQAEQGLKNYENFEYGLTFLYPQKWGNETDQCPLEVNLFCGPTFFFSSNGSIDPNESRNLPDSYFISIRAFKLDKPSGTYEACNCSTLKQFLVWDYASRNNQDIAFINDNQTIIGSNYSAWQTEIQYDATGTKQLLVHTINGNTGYTFTFSGPADNKFGRYMDDFKNMLKSVKLINPPPEKKPSFLN